MCGQQFLENLEYTIDYLGLFILLCDHKSNFPYLYIIYMGMLGVCVCVERERENT